jgi:hypothetical protein
VNLLLSLPHSPFLTRKGKGTWQTGATCVYVPSPSRRVHCGATESGVADRHRADVLSEYETPIIFRFRDGIYGARLKIGSSDS